MLRRRRTRGLPMVVGGRRRRGLMAGYTLPLRVLLRLLLRLLLLRDRLVPRRKRLPGGTGVLLVLRMLRLSIVGLVVRHMLVVRSRVRVYALLPARVRALHKPTVLLRCRRCRRLRRRRVCLLGRNSGRLSQISSSHGVVDSAVIPGRDRQTSRPSRTDAWRLAGVTTA